MGSSGSDEFAAVFFLALVWICLKSFLSLGLCFVFGCSLILCVVAVSAFVLLWSLFILRVSKSLYLLLLLHIDPLQTKTYQNMLKSKISWLGERLLSSFFLLYTLFSPKIEEHHLLVSLAGPPSLAFPALCAVRFEIIDLQPDIPADHGDQGIEGPCSIAFEDWMDGGREKNMI